MKRWIMIHKIKALYDDGNGLSHRAIAKELGLSRNTVKKYLQMNVSEIEKRHNSRNRKKDLDRYERELITLLQKYPRLSSLKARRKLGEQNIEIHVKERRFCAYIKALKTGLVLKQKRYYEPVLDHLPGEQCQIDVGELREVKIGGDFHRVYFVVFVLSFSRMMYVGFSLKSLQTEKFIQLHDEAFRFFGGVVKECVYDQTKLVAIREEFREVWFNDRFYHYATAVVFDIRVCEGYDPESKGKVEAGVKYVKNDFFYGEEFKDGEDLQQRLKTWLENQANQRIHGTTVQKPAILFEEKEKTLLHPYLSPGCLNSSSSEQLRQVDKTSLISWKSVKYSVPMNYQQSTVRLKEDGGELLIFDYYSGEEIARHALSFGKGSVQKNSNHYRDHQKQIEDYETLLGEYLSAELLLGICALLKASNPKIYKDQLFGLLSVLKSYSAEELKEPFEEMVKRSELKVSFIKAYLAARFSSRWQAPSGQQQKKKTGALLKYQILTSNPHQEGAYV